jgi:hypothetical protein
MARTIPQTTWDTAWRDFYRCPDTSPRALGRLARAHGLRLSELRKQMKQERWELKSRRLRAESRARDSARWLAKARRQALQLLAAALPPLRSGKTDVRTLRALRVAAFRAGHSASNACVIASWLLEAQDDLTRAVAGKPYARPSRAPLKFPRPAWY